MERSIAVRRAKDNLRRNQVIPKTWVGMGIKPLAVGQRCPAASIFSIYLMGKSEKQLDF
jgi:hypothetical protein